MKMMDKDTRLALAQVDELFEKLEDHRVDDIPHHMIDEIGQFVKPYLHSYEQLIGALDHAASMMVLDLNGRVAHVDDHFCRVLKARRADLLNRFLIDLIDRDTCDSDMKGYIEGDGWKHVVQGELSFTTPDHHPCWMHTTIVPMQNRDSEGDSVLVIAVDITHYKLQARQDFTQTMDALVNIVFKVERNDPQTYVYTMFEGKLAHDIGLTTETVKGRKLEDIFPGDQAEFFKSQYDQGFKGEVISYKHQYKGRYFQTTLSPIKENGCVVEVIGSAVEITSYEEAESRIQHMASHDPLTDLPNRSKLQEDLSQWVDGFQPNIHHLTVIFCNLDRFKYVNDAMGHIAGDQVIQLMAERINSCLTLDDRLYRLGGDEFMMCLRKDRTRSEITKLGRQVLHRISQPIHLLGKRFFMTASLGIAQYPDEASTAGELLANADLAMHYCKMNGRQNLLFYSPHMNEYYDRMLSMEGALREAISRNELRLHYQPKVDVRTGFISGMEALVRWYHPEHGYISPAQFIPLAEETGLITQLDEWVLEEACRQNQAWINSGYAPERIAVNVSANEFQRSDFAEKINRILQSAQLEPQYLEIEVTENSVMRNTEECIRTMQDLKALGVSLSIDDFGTGYSSLSYLRQFPIHFLKIDQAFIKGVLHDPSDAEIVKAMIQLADAFKLEVIAEGVEDEEVLSFLRENNCSYYQGYHFSKPLPPEEMERLLTKKHRYF